jgi:hypothetical protein
MGGIAALGSFAGGLAGGFTTEQTAESVRAQKAAQTDALTKETAHAQDLIAGRKEYAAKLKAWREGGMQGPAPIAPVGDADSGTLPTAISGTPAAATNPTVSSGAPVRAADPTRGRMKVAQALKASGFDKLASGVANGERVDLPQPSAASPGAGLTPPTGPYSMAPATGPASGMTDDE